MPRSLFSFAQALKLVDEQAASTALDRVLGGALFAGAAAAGPAAPAVLSLVDPKNEAVKLLAPVVDGLTAKAQGTSGVLRQDLLVAAHTITVLSSFFDAVGKQTRLELTEEDKRRLAGVPAEGGFVHRTLTVEVPFPSVEHPLLDNLDKRLRPLFAELAVECLRFLQGSAGFTGPHDPAHIVNHAARLYHDRMLQLGPKEPFALWVTLIEHGATHRTLSDLERLLRLVTAGSLPTGYRAKLAGLARAVLDKRLLRTDKGGMVTPTIREGFVEPAFRHVRYDGNTPVSDDNWWREYQGPARDDLVGYLASYLADDASTELPLLVLGDPGAGKSLLTEVLAAYLPAETFAVLRVPLRDIAASDKPSTQITKQLRRALLTERVEFEDLLRECGPCTTCIADERQCIHQARLVVLFDGFDELVQASGVTQSGYLEEIRQFQRHSIELKAPVAVVVTSRTVVADHTEIPLDTPVIHIDRFDDARIQRWTTAWNTAREGTDGFVPLLPETLVSNESVARLARDPLLLLVLAIYLAEEHQSGFVDESLTSAQLYRRLLDKFIERQVGKNLELAAAHRQRLQRRQRLELQITAFGMFNRGRQNITYLELEGDLAALSPAPAHEQTKSLDEPLTEARRVLSEFLFIHDSRMRDKHRGTYEFLHATFGEYLVAEFIATELSRFAKVRKADEESALSDSLFSRLLSHEPVCQRTPILDFVRELAPDGPLDVLEDLLTAARRRPDIAEDSYRPVAYDPIRRRAAYLANLVLLRVHLDPAPVPPAAMAESPTSWASIVHLWRAGLPSTSWASVIETLVRVKDGVTTFARFETVMHGLDSKEADLADEISFATVRAVGENLCRYSIEWSRDDLSVQAKVASLMSTRTATSGLGNVLPFDRENIREIAESCEAADQLNSASQFLVGRTLTHNASDLPIDLAERITKHSLDGNSATDLAASIAAHPQLLDRIPELHERIISDPQEYLSVITILWKAEQRYGQKDADLIRNLRLDADQRLSETVNSSFNSAFFTPAYISYLRTQRPPHWNDLQDLRDELAAMDPEILESIDPVDASFIAGNDGVEFAQAFLQSRGIEFMDDRAIETLRDMAER